MKIRIMSIILIFLMAFSFTSCSRAQRDDEASEDRQAGENYKNNKDNDKGNSADKTDAGTVDAGAVDAGKADIGDDVYAIDVADAKLPEELRTDLVPIMKGSKILEFTEDPSMTEFFIYHVACSSELPYEAVMSFYKELMSHYDVDYEDEQDDTYVIAGKMDDSNSIEIIVINVNGEVGPHYPKGTNTYFELMYRRPHK